MNPFIGWALALVAVAAGWAGYGWPGVALAVTVIVFWMLLQFNRILRVLRQAGQRPMGQIDNAVMLHSRLQHGMKLLQVLPLARSLGRKVADDPETFVWTDAGGDSVRVEFARGRLARWSLERAANEAPAAATAPPAAP